jgi:hypothetical protein
MARKENKPLLGKKEQATEDDKKALAACSYWDKTYNTVLFFYLFHYPSGKKSSSTHREGTCAWQKKILE